MKKFILPRAAVLSIAFSCRPILSLNAIANRFSLADFATQEIILPDLKQQEVLAQPETLQEVQIGTPQNEVYWSNKIKETALPELDTQKVLELNPDFLKISFSPEDSILEIRPEHTPLHELAYIVFYKYGCELERLNATRRGHFVNHITFSTDDETMTLGAVLAKFTTPEQINDKLRQVSFSDNISYRVSSSILYRVFAANYERLVQLHGDAPQERTGALTQIAQDLGLLVSALCGTRCHGQTLDALQATISSANGQLSQPFTFVGAIYLRLQEFKQAKFNEAATAFAGGVQDRLHNSVHYRNGLQRVIKDYIALPGSATTSAADSGGLQCELPDRVQDLINKELDQNAYYPQAEQAIGHMFLDQFRQVMSIDQLTNFMIETIYSTPNLTACLPNSDKKEDAIDFLTSFGLNQESVTDEDGKILPEVMKRVLLATGVLRYRT